jgi:DNA-binding NtrC family response regulator
LYTESKQLWTRGGANSDPEGRDGSARPVSQAPWRVLVVEDFDQLRDLLVAGLRDAGYQVQGVASVAEAVRVPPDGYHVLVSDMRLGDEDGARLLDLIGAQDPTIVSRCVLMTGGGFDRPLPAEVPVLAKPFRVEELVAAVSRLLERHRSTERE